MRLSAEGASFDRHQSAPDYARGAGLCLTSSLPPAHMGCTRSLWLALALVSGSPRGTSYRAPLVTDWSFEQLSNSLVGESQYATGVAHRQVSSLDQVCSYGGAHRRSLSLQYLCLAPHLSRAPYFLL